MRLRRGDTLRSETRALPSGEVLQPGPRSPPQTPSDTRILGGPPRPSVSPSSATR